MEFLPATVPHSADKAPQFCCAGSSAIFGEWINQTRFHAFPETKYLRWLT
jgi:hypothetical protein